MVKTGECPRLEEGNVGLCWEECNNDGDCAGDSKCCSNGCGHVCMNPAGKWGGYVFEQAISVNRALVLVQTVKIQISL